MTLANIRRNTMKRRDFMKLGAGLGLAGLSAEFGTLPARAQATTKFKASGGLSDGGGDRKPRKET
jgi:hypothetical protein